MIGLNGESWHCSRRDAHLSLYTAYMDRFGRGAKNIC